jgi:hypothetical protein
MRRLILAGLAATFVIATYAGAGYWLAPRLVREALFDQAGRLGLELRLGDVRTDPFRLSVALSGIEIRGPGDSALATAQGAHADLAWASLWSEAWIVQRASLYQPKVKLELDAQGGLNWPMPAGDSQAPQRQQGGRALMVERLAISDGWLELVDRSRGPPAVLELEALGIDAADLATASPEQGTYAVSARVVGGFDIYWVVYV